jgi:hypothetical protein
VLTRGVLEVLDAEEVPRFQAVIRRLADIAATVGKGRPDQLHDYEHLAEEVSHARQVR